MKMAEFRTPVKVRTTSTVQHEKDTGPRKITIPPSPCMKQLGYGTGVSVYLMERYSPLHGCYKSPWAVKKINRRIEDEKGEYTKRLSFEAEILKDLSHQNIIGYRSYTSYQDGTKCLAMESGEKSLADIIEVQQEEELGPFSSQQILKVARDISSALTYLHEEKRLLHGDLKSANILIKGNFEIAKLCDFGVTLKLNDKGEASVEDECYVGTECWSAPEALVGATVTHKTDMFSFGLVVWEMLSLSPPHVDKLNCNETKDAEDTDSLDGETDEYFKALGSRPALPDIEMGDDYLPVLEIFYACTESEQARRPSAKQVLHVLYSIEDQKKNTENLENTYVKGGSAKDK